MSEMPARTDTPITGATPPAAGTREELEARVDEARQSITETVEQIKTTVDDRVDAVADTVTGLVSMTEQFQREPVAWSLGALSAGFAMGYSLGRAHHAKSANGRPSPAARLADDLAAELAAFGNSLVSPGMSAELRATFGVDLTAALERIAALQTRPRARKRARTRPKRVSAPPRKRTRVPPQKRPSPPAKRRAGKRR